MGLRGGVPGCVTGGVEQGAELDVGVGDGDGGQHVF